MNAQRDYNLYKYYYLFLYVSKARSKVESGENLVLVHGKKNGPSVLSSLGGAYCKNKSHVEVSE